MKTDITKNNMEQNEIKPDDFNLDRIEYETILRALKHYSGNRAKTAKALGLTRPTLYRKLDKHNIR